MKQEMKCNSCGRPLEAREDHLHVRKEWGYFSRKDATIQEWRLCEECYDRLLLGFSIPAMEEDVTELI